MSVISISKPVHREVEENEEDSVVTPGQLITSDPVWMRGHGTYSLGDDTYSSCAGTISKVNKLLSVIPLRGRYSPETGDHLVGRITEVGARRWKVDIGAKTDAILQLGSVNLPGGILRRKSDSDELEMRNFLKEGDLLNCEVQNLYQDGSLSLHTRSLKYGKLRNGILFKLPSSLVIRSKNHHHHLPGGVSVIIGLNGFIWIYKTPPVSQTTTTTTINKIEETSSWEIYSDQNDDISVNLRNTISRYYNVLRILTANEIGISEARIVSLYELSMYHENVNDLIILENIESLGMELTQMEKMRGNAA